jgi:hypothetical protein
MGQGKPTGPEKPREPSTALSVTKKPKPPPTVTDDFDAPGLADEIADSKTKKPHLTLQVEQELLDRLDRYLARVRKNPEQAGASRGSIVRAAVDAYLKRHRS